jgi:hypothetical protein
VEVGEVRTADFLAHEPFAPHIVKAQFAPQHITIYPSRDVLAQSAARRRSDRQPDSLSAPNGERLAVDPANCVESNKQA